MIVLSDSFLMEKASAFLLLSIRISAFFLVSPLFANTAVSLPIRIALMAGLTFALMGAVTPPSIEIMSPAGVIVIVREVIIGVSVGVIFQILFSAVAMAGEHIALSMGLGFASMMDPSNGTQSVVVAQFLNIMLILIFLVTEGHHVVLRQLFASYKVAPIGGSLDASLFMGIVQTAALVFSAALIICLPAIVLLFLVNVLIGFMTRVAQQMNIFSIGFPLTILAGFMMIFVSLPTMGAAMVGLIQTASGVVRNLILETRALP